MPSIMGVGLFSSTCLPSFFVSLPSIVVGIWGSSV